MSIATGLSKKIKTIVAMNVMNGKYCGFMT